MIKNNNINEITSQQAVVLIIAIQLGFGFMTLPSNMVKIAGHDAWIPVPIIGIFLFIMALIIVLLCKKHGNQDIFEINQTLFGRYFSYVPNSIFLLYLFLSSVANLSFLTLSIHVWLFRLTPVPVLILYVSFPSIYLAYKGLKGICRLNFLLAFTIPVMFSVLFLNAKYFHITNLFPVGKSGIPNIAETLKYTSFSFLGFESLLLTYKLIKNKQDFIKHSIIGAIFTISTITFFVIFSIGVFGEHMLPKKINSYIELARMAKAPVIERLDLYYFVIWISAMLLTINAYFFFTHYATKKIFKIRSDKVSVAIASAIIMVITYFVTIDVDRTFKFTEYTSISLVFIGVVYPLILLLISWIRRKGTKKKV
jgi:spore germination protein (amino acid permease)